MTFFQNRGGSAGLVAAFLFSSTCIAAVPAAAQERTASRSFSIPAGPLSQSLVIFGRQAGLQISYQPSIARGKSAPSVSGNVGAQVALSRLLAGSGISYRVQGNIVYLSTVGDGAGVVGSADGSTVLGTITVEGENATGPLTGLVATRSATGTKTDTPLLDTAASVSVVGEPEMKRRSVTNLDQALAYTSGVNTNLYGADKRYDFIAIRGFVETGKGIYRDGLQNRVNNFTGSRIEPYGMQRLEVMKGSTSTLYGLNAPGGLVNMITKRPQETKFGEVYTTFGEDHAETGTDFGGPIDAEGDWTYRLTGKWQNAEDGFDWAKDDRVYIAPALTWKPTDATSLTFLADYNKRKGANRYGIPLGSGLDPDTFLGEKSLDRNDTIEKNIGYVFDHDFGNGLKFNQTARYTDINLVNRNVFPSEISTARRNVMLVDGDLQRFAIDSNLQYDTSFDRFDSRTLVGIDYSRTKEDQSDIRGYIRNADGCNPTCVIRPMLPGTSAISSGSERTLGLYVQEELTLDDRWILSLGGRYDKVQSSAESVFPDWLGLSDSQSVDEHAFTSRVGLTWKATDQISLYGTYSESFAPVSPLPSLLGSGLVSAAKPVEGVMYEAGIKYRPEGMNALFSAAVFDISQTNVPVYRFFTQRHQIGKVDARGIELEAKAELTDRLNMTIAYAYTDSEIIEGEGQGQEGNRMQFIPAHSASAWVDYTVPGNGTLGDLTMGLGARFVGARYGDNNNTVKLASFTVFDAALNYKVTDNASLSVNVLNLFDKEYINHVETFSTPDTAFYGDRRTIRATLKYTW
ncbi:TonB-dependent siderophore receptor [Rhizobium panacihumi]|uniref:TonB-dependent siderophore receptor n=1 Tax=Rhizobium panacihumi TaxID=2008450 RepID=UPI003D78E157